MSTDGEDWKSVRRFLDTRGLAAIQIVAVEEHPKLNDNKEWTVVVQAPNVPGLSICRVRRYGTARYHYSLSSLQAITPEEMLACMAKKNSSRGVKAAEKKLEKAGYKVLAQVKGGDRIDREHIFVVLSPLGHVMQARIKRGEDRPYRFGPVMTLDESLAYLDRTRAKDNGDGWVKEIMREWEESGYRVIDFDPHPTAIGYKLTLETPEGVIFHSFERPPWDLPPKTKPAKKNPRASFRSVPAVGHARAALQREGFSRLSFVRRAPGSRGPVLVFLGWRDETEYVLNVGRTSGDNLQVLSRPMTAQDRKVLTTGRQNPLPEDDEVREARKVLQDQFGSGHQASYPIFAGKEWRTDHKGNGVTTYIFAMKLGQWDGYAGQYWFWTVDMPTQFTQRMRALTPEEQLAVLVNMPEGEP